MQNKSELRRALLATRDAIVNDQRRHFDNSIATKILAWWEMHRFSTLGVYWPMRGEPDLHALYASLAEQGVQLALPTVVGADQPLQFIRWTPDEAVHKDRFGACIPSTHTQAIMPAALLVPCLGFTRAGYRLGYGGGFYDRTLALSPRPHTVGVAYADGEVEFAPDPYDIPLEVVITEQATFTVKGKCPAA